MSTRTASRPIGATMTDPRWTCRPSDMAVPMPGFPAHRDFVLVRLHDEGLLYAFTSVEDPELRFLVAPPEPFFPDYAPEIENEVFAALNTKDPDRLLIMVVITRRRQRDHGQPARPDRRSTGTAGGPCRWC